MRSKCRYQRGALSRTNENIYKTTFHDFSGCWRGGFGNEKHLSCLYCNTSIVQTREIFISKASASRTKRRESMEAARLETFQSRLWSFAEWWEPGEREQDASPPLDRVSTDSLLSHRTPQTSGLCALRLHLVHVHALFVTYPVRLEWAKKHSEKPLEHAGLVCNRSIGAKRNLELVHSPRWSRGEHRCAKDRHFIHFK